MNASMQQDNQPNIAGSASAAPPTLVLIDGNALYHRSFHAFPEEISTSAGEPTNAVFGFARMILDVMRFIRPDYLVMTFDRPTPTFRHKAFGPYKAHRPPLPDALKAQWPRTREVVAAFGMPVYELDGFEADDLLGTLSLQAEQQQVRTVIATGDMDTLQLVDEWVRVTFARSPRRGEFEYFDIKAVEERYGFAPPRLVDYKSLVGDKSDNIPGVPGVGDKTATKLIQQYGALEEILAHLDELTGRTQTSIRENAEQAKQSKYLATIVRDAPVTLDLEAAHAMRYDTDTVLKLFRELEFHTLVDRLPRLDGSGAVVAGAPTTAVTAPVRRAVPTVSDAARAAEAELQPSLFSQDALLALSEDDDNVPFTPPQSLPRALSNASNAATNTLVIETPEALAVLARSLATADIFAFDLETDSTNELQAKIVGLSFALGEGEAFYIPVGHVATAEGAEAERQIPLAQVLDALRPALTNPAVGKVGHNAKYDMMVLATHGVWVEGLRFDTMVGAYLLNPGRRSLGLKEQAFEVLGVIMTPISELIGTGKKQITMAQVPARVAAEYAGADADMTLRLLHVIQPKLRERDLESLMRDIELPLVPVLARMELSGILVDPDFLRRLGTELDEQARAIEQRIYDSVGHRFNIGSTKQLADVLFVELSLKRGRKTKTGYSVDSEVLDSLAGQHEIVDYIREYRELVKLKSTYVDGIVELLNPDDGRVHTSFNQTISATGRLSSSNPNLQNIPVRTESGRRIRRAFLADPGSNLLAADYSQIELRILAHITREPGLVAAFEADEDIHAATAAQLFKIPLAEVAPEQRRLAKTVNFAVLYGQSAFGLARVTGMSMGEAGEFIRNYDLTFPRVKEYTQSTLTQVREQGYVQTLLGRRRYFGDFAALPIVQRQAAEREAVNMPIQGTNADMIKIAMVRLQRELEERRLGTRMILQVHDELVLEVPDAEVSAASGLVREAMVSALILSVPVKVELKMGRNWYEVQPLR